MEGRIVEEFQLLQEVYTLAIRKERWIWLPEYALPEGWSSRNIPVAFFIRDGYPATGPYGIHVPSGLRFKDTLPNNFNDSVEGPPFEGKWGMFSWECEGWRPTADPRGGHNLLTWVRGFAARFKEGV